MLQDLRLAYSWLEVLSAVSKVQFERTYLFIGHRDVAVVLRSDSSESFGSGRRLRESGTKEAEACC